MDDLTEQTIQEIARTLDKAGLRLEDHFRCLDKGAAFTKAALRVLSHRGFDFAPVVGADSLIISGANGWVMADKQSCTAMVVEAVKTVDLKLDAVSLLYQARYCDRALMRLAGLVHDGLELKCEEAFKHER